MNKYPYRDSEGRQVIGGPLTGWLYSDTYRHTKCPECWSDPGYLCETPRGREADTPHEERVTACIEKFGGLGPWSRNNQ